MARVARTALHQGDHVLRSARTSVGHDVDRVEAEGHRVDVAPHRLLGDLERVELLDPLHLEGEPGHHRRPQDLGARVHLVAHLPRRADELRQLRQGPAPVGGDVGLVPDLVVGDPAVGVPGVGGVERLVALHDRLREGLVRRHPRRVRPVRCTRTRGGPGGRAGEDQRHLGVAGVGELHDLVEPTEVEDTLAGLQVTPHHPGVPEPDRTRRPAGTRRPGSSRARRTAGARPSP